MASVMSKSEIPRGPFYGRGKALPPPATIATYTTRIRESEQAVLDAIGKNLGYEGWEDLLVRWTRSAVPSFAVGGEVIESQEEPDGIRTITKFKLREVSIVPGRK